MGKRRLVEMSGMIGAELDVGAPELDQVVRCGDRIWASGSVSRSRALRAPSRFGIMIEDYRLDRAVRTWGMPQSQPPLSDDAGLDEVSELLRS